MGHFMKGRLMRHAALAAILSGCAATAQAQVVISQVYGGGGNTGATLRSDFVELHNNGTSAVDLSGWSVQYASSTGASWQVTPLNGSIAPGGYYLVKQADGTGGTVSLPTPDATGTIAMAGGAGKVALSSGASALSGTCPANIDFVGFGSAANCAEGSAPTATLSATTAALRADGGCTDSNNNGADFTAGAPAPRNSASAPNVCGGGGQPILSVADAGADEASGTLSFVLHLSQPAGAGGVGVTYATADGTALAGSDYVAASGTVTFAEGEDTASVQVALVDDALTESDETFFLNLSDVIGALSGDVQALGTIVNDDVSLTPIHDIQGNGATSPFANQLVYTTGIVTGRKSNGFFLQASDAEADADPMTSEGVFVFTSIAPPAAAAVGNRVRVGGTVSEYIPAADPNQLPLTELNSTSVALLSSGNPLPSPMALTPTFPDPNGPLDQLEPLEGMRVTVASLTVAAATEGNTNESNATGTSNGILHAVVTGVARPFREPGIQAPDPAPAGSSIPPIPRWDFNPELLTIDSDTLGGSGFVLDLAAGAVIEGLTGPLDYGFRRYTLLRDPSVAITTTPGPAPRAARAASADEFTIAGYNLERFFDTVNDPATGEPVLTASAFANRLSKASLAVRDYLNAPDILATVEVENLGTLQALASRINGDAVAAGQPDPHYVAYLEEGNDVGGIDVGFLVKTAEVGTGIARVQVTGVTQQGKDVTWTEPSGTVSLLNDRPPLVLDAVVHYADGRTPFPVTVIAVHQRSLNDVDSVEPSGPTTLGARVRLKRQHQAEYLATLIQQMQVADPARRIVTLGDFNAFAFNDGLADTMNVVTGTPTPDEQTAVPGDGVDLVDPDLVNLGVLEPADERYSFVFGGNAQTLDHVLANEETILASTAFGLDHARINADFPEIARNDVTSPARLSDHDPLVAYFEVRRRADLAVTATADAATVNAGEMLRYTATVTNLGPDLAAATAIGFALNAETATFAVVAPSGWNCDAAQIANGMTSVACHNDGLANGASASFAISATSTTAQIGSSVNLAVAATTQSFDPVAGNDEAVATIAVQAAPAADLALEFNGPATVPASTLLHRLHRHPAQPGHVGCAATGGGVQRQHHDHHRQRGGSGRLDVQQAGQQPRDEFPLHPRQPGRGCQRKLRYQSQCQAYSGQPHGAGRRGGDVGRRGCGRFQQQRKHRYHGLVLARASAMYERTRLRPRPFLWLPLHEPLPWALLRCKAALSPRFLNMARLIIGFTCNGNPARNETRREIRDRIPAIPWPGWETRPR